MVHLSSKVPRFAFTTTHYPLGLMQHGVRKLFKHPCLSIYLSVSLSLSSSSSSPPSVCVCVLEHLHMHVKLRGQLWVSFLRYCPLFFKAESLSDPQVNLLGQNGWLDIPTDPLGHISECTPPCSAFLCGFWGLNSGLHASKVSALPSE